MSILNTIICLLLSSVLSSRLLVPTGDQPTHGWPAVVLLHDHGARFEKGWEKVIGTDPESYYSGMAIGDSLVAQGYVVIASTPSIGVADVRVSLNSSSAIPWVVRASGTRGCWRTTKRVCDTFSPFLLWIVPASQSRVSRTALIGHGTWRQRRPQWPFVSPHIG